MSNSYVETSTRGLGTNMKNALSGVLVGILLFLGSFVVLWYNEGRLDMSKVAKKAEILAPGVPNAAMNGKWVSLSAPVTLVGQIEDPLYINPGPYLAIERKVEMYAWIKKVEEKEEKQTGGSTKVTKTTTYSQGWVSAENVEPLEMVDGNDYRNPVPNVKSDTISASQATIGGYGFDPKKTDLPPSAPLQLNPTVLKPGFNLREGYIYLPSAFTISPSAAPGAAPAVSAAYNTGDIRISFQVVTAPTNATIFGTVSNGAIIEYMAEDGSPFLRLFASDRESAIKLLSAEFTMITWILRLVGFLCMWIGMQMFFGPLNTLLDILPFLGSAGRFLVGAVLFPIALVLSVITILVAIIFHNIYLMIAVIVLIVGGVLWRAKSKKAAK